MIKMKSGQPEGLWTETESLLLALDSLRGISYMPHPFAVFN